MPIVGVEGRKCLRRGSGLSLTTPQSRSCSCSELVNDTGEVKRGKRSTLRDARGWVGLVDCAAALEHPIPAHRCRREPAGLCRATGLSTSSIAFSLSRGRAVGAPETKEREKKR